MKKYKGQEYDLTGNVNENDILVEFAKKLKESKTKMEGFKDYYCIEHPTKNSKVKKMKSVEMKKESYRLPENFDMYDMCYCASKDCKTKCARKQISEGIHTVSDFTEICKEYKK